jgi:hypothetical protein
MILEQQTYLRTPLLVFHDQTPVLTVRSLTGLIEIDKAEESYLGVDTSFWIVIALTYLEFLEEREVCCSNVQAPRMQIDFLFFICVVQGFLAALSD